jgi:hypothetical protein
MSHKSQQKKQQKKKARERRIKHDANMRRNNLCLPKFRLDVLLDGTWRMGVLAFRTIDSVLAYQADTEKRRLIGEEIAEGKVVDVETGEVRVTIAASKQIKESLPDKLAGNPESAAKAIVDNQKDLPDNLKV